MPIPGRARETNKPAACKTHRHHRQHHGHDTMLPSHLLDPSKARSHIRLGGPPPPLPPSLCVTGALSQIGRWTVVVAATDEKNDDDDDDDIAIEDTTSNIELSYCIFRPRQLHDVSKPPLVVIHGGPSIPSNYLLPIVNGVTDRTVILYDQYGCGKSTRPTPTSRKRPPTLPKFSIPTMVEHFRQLIEECWKLRSYHLLGHSFGGILAYEYLKMIKQQLARQAVDASVECRCRSLVLASTPTSARLIEDQCQYLMKQLKDNNYQHDGGGKVNSNNNKKNVGGDNDSDNDDDANANDNDKDPVITNEMDHDDDCSASQLLSDEFRQTHECRLLNIPLALMDAIAQAGPIPWRGIPAIRHYVATPTSCYSSSHVDASVGDDGDDDDDDMKKEHKIQIHIPTLLLRGEYDFCTERCMVGWGELITVDVVDDDGDDDDQVLGAREATTSSSTSHVKITALKNCSHYSMLEDERQFGKVVLEFLQRHDDDKNEGHRSLA
jgi:pimeloyl-ACP methyl ester carboxylesterase